MEALKGCLFAETKGEEGEGSNELAEVLLFALEEVLMIAGNKRTDRHPAWAKKPEASSWQHTSTTATEFQDAYTSLLGVIQAIVAGKEKNNVFFDSKTDHWRDGSQCIGFVRLLMLKALLPIGEGAGTSGMSS
ncbi:hypothetical protein Tco_0121370 [Tanacetum coccineum]